MPHETIDPKKAPISVARIKDVSFLTRNEFFKKDSSEIRFFIDHQVGFNTTAGLAILTLRLTYAYPDALDKIAMEIEVENVFEIIGLDKYIPNAPPVTKENMNVPSEILITMVSLAVSHTRALLARNTMGTVYESIMLPILDPVALAKHFFKEKVDDSIYSTV